MEDGTPTHSETSRAFEAGQHSVCTPCRFSRPRPSSLADLDVDYEGLITAAADAADREEDSSLLDLCDGSSCWSPPSVFASHAVKASSSSATPQANQCARKSGAEATLSASTSASSIPARGEVSGAAKSGAAESGGEFDESVKCSEARELEQALREAQAALDVARQFVTSPLLDSATQSSRHKQLPAPPSASQDDCSSEPQLVDGAEVWEAPHNSDEPQPASQQPESASTAFVEGEQRPLEVHEEGAPPRAGAPPNPVNPRLINALHARFGENAAKTRVERAQSLDRAERARHRAEAEARALRQPEEEAKREESRRRASKRAASERRAKMALLREAEEERLREERQRAANAIVGQRYAKNVSRRATGEQVRKAALVQEVMADVEAEQARRREEGEIKGRELQKRCEASDWSHARARLHEPKFASAQSRRESPAGSDHQRAAFDSDTRRSTPDTRSGAGDGHCAGKPAPFPPSKPRVLPVPGSRRPRSASLDRAVAAYPAPPPPPGNHPRPPAPPASLKRAGAAAAAMLRLPPLVRC